VPSRTLQHGGGRVTRVGSSAGTLHRGCETRDTSLSHKHNPTTQTFVRLDRHCVYDVLRSFTNTR